MRILQPGERELYDSPFNPNQIRIGAQDKNDAICQPFAVYRNADPEEQKRFQTERVIVSTREPLTCEQKMEQLKKILLGQSSLPGGGSEDQEQVFQNVLSPRIVETKILPELERTVGKDWKDVATQVKKQCVEVGKRRLYKIMGEKEKEIQEIMSELFLPYLDTILSQVSPEQEGEKEMSHLSKTAQRLEHDIILLTPEEKVLFDSHLEFPHVVLVLAHPDGRYDSIGRRSYLKDGKQKISRIFDSQDPFILYLRGLMI